MTKIDNILSYLASNPLPICDDCLSSVIHCYPRQQVNQICRRLQEGDLIVRDDGSCNICHKTKKVNHVVVGKPIIKEQDVKNTIKTIRSTELKSSTPPVEAAIFTASSIHYSWEPVLADAKSRYLFPGNITSSMKSLYHFPAIYRWVIQYPDDSVIYYVGETDQLCPRRISLYLNPGPTQQTNERLHNQFLEYLQEGCQIRIDYLRFNSFSLNSIVVDQKSLNNKNIRRAIEHLFIFQYQNQGIFLLNR